jgi:hypothetical protein
MPDQKQSYREKHGKTRVGRMIQSIGNVAPDLLQLAGDITGVEALEKLGKRLDRDPSIDQADKDNLRVAIQQDIEEAREITKRWESDNNQESWLPRNIRPLTLITVICFTLLVILLDACPLDFSVSAHAFNYLEMISLTALGGYFAVRSFDKHSKNKNPIR